MTRQEIDIQTEEKLNEEDEAANAAGIYRIPAGIKRLDADLLSSNPEAQKAEKILLPETLEEIGNYCFSGFHRLEEAVFPASVIKMGRGVFQHCWHLKRADLPSGTSYLDDQFFYGCGNLKELLVPASVEEISRDALRSCSRLKRVSVSDERFPDYPRRVKQLSAFTMMEESEDVDWESFSSRHPNAAEYVKERPRGLMDIAIAGDLQDAASFLLRYMDYSGEDLRRFSDRANEEGRTEIMALLLREIGRSGEDGQDDGEEEFFTW
ncbi:MAG: leucine-rich repeat domain-containing protein [Eubacterium sp.]